MKVFLILWGISLLISAIGFKKYVWFISIGYGGAIAGIGITLLCMYGFSSISLLAVLLIIYGCRLAGYLALRELKSSSYNKKMKTEIKEGTNMSLIAKCSIWISAALLYACETLPIALRFAQHVKMDSFVKVGIAIMILGLVIESLADYQKNQAKKLNPHRFVDTGLFKWVRCPNYLGEMLFWTGVFVSGVNILSTPLAWIGALIGYLGIIYVMFGGARRLEIRQNKNYGNDPSYQHYVKTTPIMIPFIPLYSVEKYKWLVA